MLGLDLVHKYRIMITIAASPAAAPASLRDRLVLIFMPVLQLTAEEFVPEAIMTLLAWVIRIEKIISATRWLHLTYRKRPPLLGTGSFDLETLPRTTDAVSYVRK